MVAGWVSDAAHAPPVSFGDRCDFGQGKRALVVAEKSTLVAY